MNRSCFTLVKEPKGDLYKDIIDYSVSVCDTALLVVRSTISLDISGVKVLEQLKPFIKKRSMRAEWPGTRLLDHKADVLEYYLISECASLIKKSSVGLYDWRQPRLPEDLCLLRAEDDPWLVSIAHEKDAYFCLSDEEKAMLIEAIPRLSLYIKKDES